MTDVSYSAVYQSLEYQQYLLILDDEEHAFYYAHAELVAERERQALLARGEALVEPPSYREQYRAYRETPEWRERAEAAKARFGGRCALCDAAGPLEAHHRTYANIYDEPPEDLTALCSDCHRAYHL